MVKKVIGLTAIVLMLVIVGVKASSSTKVNDTVLSACCHTLKEDPNSHRPGL